MIDDVIGWFGGQTETAKALGVSAQAVWNWCNDGQIPPARAIQIEQVTGGRFRAVEISNASRAQDDKQA